MNPEKIGPPISVKEILEGKHGEEMKKIIEDLFAKLESGEIHLS